MKRRSLKLSISLAPSKSWTQRIFINWLQLGCFCTFAIGSFASFFSPALSLAQESLDAKSTISLGRLTIREVKVSGNKILRTDDLIPAFELLSGDRLDRAKTVRTAQNIQELYKIKGYREVRISTLLRQETPADREARTAVLEYQIEEGLPDRISVVRLETPAFRSKSEEKDFQRFQAKIMARLELLKGSPLDLGKLNETRKWIQESFAVDEFPGARVEDPILTEGPDAPPLNPLEPLRKWTEVKFPIELGDRVSFGFRGNRFFSLSELKQIIDEQRLVGFGKDYVSEIENRIRAKYIDVGFAQVEVQSLNFEGQKGRLRKITYLINEGDRTPLKEVKIEGHSSFSTRNLISVFFEKSAPLVKEGFFVEKEVRASAELLVDWYKSQGYLSAKLSHVQIDWIDLPRRAGKRMQGVVATLYLIEGERTDLKRLDLVGIEGFDPAEIRGLLGVQEGRPLNLFVFAEGIQKVKALFKTKGFLQVTLENEGSDQLIQYFNENRDAEMTLKWNRGEQNRVRNIYVEGLSFTQSKVVMRELQFKSGDILTEPLLQESEGQLRRLGLFSRVTIEVLDLPESQSEKDVRIQIREGTPGVVAGGPGFREDIGARLYAQIAYNNLWGLNHTLSFSAAINRRIREFRFMEYDAQLAYQFPWFLGTQIMFRPTLTVNGQQFIKFDATTINAALTWERKLVKSGALVGFFTYNLERINQFNAAEPEVSDVLSDNRELRIGALIPGLRLDTRDNSLSPTTGWLSFLTFEWASPALLSQADTGYTRTQFRLDRHFSLPAGILFYGSYRAGYARSAQLGSPLPLIKHFALGGSGSVRGYVPQEIQRYDQSILGSLSFSNYRFQLDFPVSGNLKFGPFLDGANLLVDNSSIRNHFARDILWGTGLGIHYQTPVGPVNLDLGYQLNPQAARRSRFEFYFSIGVI